MSHQYSILTPENFPDYELLDSGAGRKLERFGSFLFVRPDPRALWKPSLPQSEWQNAHGSYERAGDGGGNWHMRTKLPVSWKLTYNTLTFHVKPTGFKHMGIFPEQAPLWDFIGSTIKEAKREIKLLNLFAYTGGSTLAAAAAGASVTHVDAEKDILTWARENAIASGLGNALIRWIPDDAMTFVKREARRGNTYDAIILDPPKFGRGSASQVWKIERDLPKLLESCREVLSQQPLFIILNAYAVGLSAVTLGNLLQDLHLPGNITIGELGIRHSQRDMILPESIFSYWIHT